MMAKGLTVSWQSEWSRREGGETEDVSIGSSGRWGLVSDYIITPVDSDKGDCLGTQPFSVTQEFTI